MGAASTLDKQRMMFDVMVTSKQRDALLTILRALDIEMNQQVFTDEEEDNALGRAMEMGRKEGIADLEEKQAFESFLFGK